MSVDRPWSDLKEPLKQVLGIPGRHPGKTRVVLRDGFSVAVGVFLLLEMVLWDSLVTDMSAHVLPDALISTNVYFGLSRLDILLFEASVAVVVGTLAGLARVGMYYWRWQRQRGNLPDQWTNTSKISGWLIGGGTLFVAVTVVIYLFGLPALARAIVVDGELNYVTPTIPSIWTILGVILCLAGGVAALVAYGMTTLATTGIAPVRSVVAAGTIVTIVGLAGGFLIWPFGMPAQMVWAGPLLVGYMAGAVLALVGPRMAIIGDSYRSVGE